MSKAIVTIGRQFGSGGHVIGALLAKIMDYSYYDKTLLDMAAQEIGLDPEIVAHLDEKSSSNRFLSTFTGFFGVDYSGTNYISSDTVFSLQSDVIRKVSELHNCVIVGRCSDYILRDNPNCTNIFITAPLEKRIERVSKRMELDPAKAAELIRQEDRRRAGYYNYYTDKVWGEAAGYHLCIDSSVLGDEPTADFIASFLRR